MSDFTHNKTAVLSIRSIAISPFLTVYNMFICNLLLSMGIKAEIKDNQKRC